MSVTNLGPLDWRIPIVTPEGRPTQEFQRRWASQISNNSQIGSITIGSGPPPANPAPTDGAQYADTSTNPYTLYVGGAGVWNLAGSSGANPTAVAGDVAINGSASTYMRSDAAPAIQKASSSQFGIVKVDGTTITETGGVISAAGGSGVGWTTIASGTISTPRPFVDFLNLGAYNEFLFIGQAITAASSHVRTLHVSTTNGASWYTTSGQYLAVAAAGTTTNVGSIGYNTGASPLARSFAVHIYNNENGQIKVASSNDGTRMFFVGSTAVINALRLSNDFPVSGSTNMNAGSYQLLGR